MFKTVHWSLGGSFVSTQRHSTSCRLCVANSSVGRGGAPGTPPQSVTERRQAPSCAAHCRKPQCWEILTTLDAMQQSISQPFSLSLSSSAMSPEALRGGGINVTCREEHSTVPYSGHLKQTCVSALTGFQYQALVCGCKHKHLVSVLLNNSSSAPPFPLLGTY